MVDNNTSSESYHTPLSRECFFRNERYRFVVKTANDPLLSQLPYLIRFPKAFMDQITDYNSNTDPNINRKLEELYENYP